MADEPASTDPLAELNAGPPESAPRRKRKPPQRARAAGVVYDRTKCRFPGCGSKNSGPRFKNFCRLHFAQMNPEPVEVSESSKTDAAPEPVEVRASKERINMAASKQPTGPEGIPLDKLAAMHEPLHVRLARVRGIGPEEPIALPGNGQNWTLTQVRNLEAWSRDTLGGGDFQAKVVDERGQAYTWQWHNAGDEKKPNTAQTVSGTVSGAASPPMPAANPVPPAPLNATAAQPANVIPIGNGMGLTTMANGVMVAVPMQSATDTAGPPANGPLNARAAAQVWGGNADAAQQFLTMTQRLERAEADKERLSMAAQHDREMSELRATVARLAEKPQPTGPDPAVTARIDALAQQNAELQRQLAAKDVESRHREEMTELRRALEKQGEDFKALIKETATPKEDPFLRALVDAQSKQADAMAAAAKAQADAQVAVAKLQSEASAASIKSQNDMYTLLISKNDTATTIAPLMQAFAGVSQLTQGMTSAMLDIVKEVAEIKGEKGEKWYEALLKPVLEQLPQVGQTLAEGYAMSQQARLRGAPTAVAAKPAPERKPRVEITGNDGHPNLPREEKPAEAPASGNGAGTVPVKETPIDLALRGYDSNIPGDKEQYDANVWASALPEILAVRKAVLDSKATPSNIAQALVQLVAHKEQFGLADGIPAFKQIHDGSDESLATFVGLALGPCPEKVDAAAFMKFKRDTFALFGRALREFALKMREAENGTDGADDGVDDNDGDDGADDGSAPPQGDAPQNPEIPGASA